MRLSYPLKREIKKEPVFRLRNSAIQQVAIDIQVIILEHIEDDLDIAVCCFFILFYS